MEDRVRVGLVVFSENLVELFVGLVAVHFAALFCHADSAKRHEGALERLVCLKTYNLLQVFLGTVGENVAGLVGSKACDNVGVKVKNARALLSVKACGLLCVLGFLQALKLVKKFLRGLCRTGKEFAVSVIGSVVKLNELADVDFVLPKTAGFKTVPLFSHKNASINI